MHQVNTPDHDYLSTACHHDEHDDCRQECKFCPAACECKCHRPPPCCKCQPQPDPCDCKCHQPKQVHQMLLIELYRSGRGHHLDPKKSKPRPETLLWRCFVPRGEPTGTGS